MKNKFLRSDYIIFSFAIIGILFYFYFYHQISPRAGIHLELTKKQVEEVAFQIVKDFGYDVSQHNTIVKFYQDADQIKYLTKQYGIREAIELMKHKIPAYYWKIRWKKPKDILKELRYSDEEVTVNVGTEDTSRALGDFDLSLSTNGKILKFKANLEKKLEQDSIQNFKAAEALFQQIEGDDFTNYKFQQQSKDTSSAFKWVRDEPIVGEKIEVTIQMHHAHLITYNKSFSPPEEVIRGAEHTNFLHIPSIVVFFLFFIVIIVILVQKLRRDEISIKSGIVISILVGLATAVTIFFSSYQETSLEILIPILLGPLFVGFSLLAVVGVSESLSREVWAEKLITFDALNKFKILFSKFSKSIFYGVSLAFLSSGIAVVVVKLFSYHPEFYFHIGKSNISEYVLIFPLLYILCSSFISSSFSEFIFRLFTISFLRKRLNSGVWIIVISAFLWTFSVIGDNKTISIPIYLHLLKNFIIGVVFAYFFLRYDFLTVFIGSLLFLMIEGCHPMLFWGDSMLMWNGILLWAIIALLLIIGILGFNKQINERQLSQYVPPYVHRMQERERIKRELEIARKVQLSFLPGEVPKIPGLDVATICIPASEVGGDYFDFIELDEGKLGIVIGDVSGKGIPAAFHMTLTKGFLKSQAKETTSPREVLIRLNELFYENVARGTFISMIYGVFDVTQQTLTFARAGHNPLIIRSGSNREIELLCPKGIALGLEKGKLFNQFIEEQKVSIHKNDIFIFYTDGVSEAMNKEKIEFGEQRLQRIIKSNSQVLANELIEIIQNKIQKFVGNTQQHDDMTMIIVKVL